MIKVSIPWVVEVIAAIDALDSLNPQSTANETFLELHGARYQLEQVFNASVYSHYLRTSRHKANELYSALGDVIDLDEDKADKPISWRAAAIKSTKDHFKLVFLSEISTLPIYMVPPKDNFDVPLLIEEGPGLFPPSMPRKAPETVPDAHEVGKALAYGLSTACGFHVFRIVESVLRRYWDHVAPGKDRPHPETLGKISADMESQKLGDIKIIESLKMIAKHHRNPFVHYDAIWSDEEALGVIGMARSVLGAMLAVLPDVPPTTGATVSSAEQASQ